AQQAILSMLTLKSRQQECFKELKIADAEAKKISNDILVPYADNYKDYNCCLYKKLGLFVKEKINDAAMIAFAVLKFGMMPTESMRAKVNACKSKEPVDCKILAKYFSCLTKTFAG
ncbi:hypothetical protein KR093_010713, partial [Drosophila rubida]